MAKASNIRDLHSKLKSILEELSGLSLQFRASQEGWERLTLPKKKIYFELTGADAFFTQLERGAQRAPCFPLDASARDSKSLWWSWNEEWRVRAVGDFALVGGGFSFLWGNASRRVQVFRAEWDDVSERGNAVGQPHWHIDDALFAEAWSGIGSESSDLLEGITIERVDEARGGSGARGGDSSGDSSTESDYASISDSGIAEAVSEIDMVDVSGVHFFMGGWHHAEVPPACWQHKLDTEPMLKWASSTFQYVKREARRIREL